MRRAPAVRPIKANDLKIVTIRPLYRDPLPLNVCTTVFDSSCPQFPLVYYSVRWFPSTVVLIFHNTIIFHSSVDIFHPYSAVFDSSVPPLREENWPFFLKLHLQWRCEFLHERWNPLSGDKEYKDLSIRDKVDILHRLCNWRLELDDIGDLLRVRREGEGMEWGRREGVGKWVFGRV